jgi:hypothetical protein
MQTRSIAYASLLAASLLFLACSSNSSGLNTDGHGGNAAQGGRGAGTGGTTDKGSGGHVGGVGGSGGHTGGLGGNAGTGGTTQCVPPPCAPPICPFGIAPAPPCGCESCLPAPDGGIDSGTSHDASKDVASVDARPCLPVACPALLCRIGYVPSPTPCGCPTCVPVDGGALDADPKDGSTICPPIVCPLLACPVGVVSAPIACGCPTCSPFSAQGK